MQLPRRWWAAPIVQAVAIIIFFVALYNDVQLALGIGARGAPESGSYPALLQQLSGTVLPGLHGVFFGMVVSAILYAAAEGHWPWFEDVDWAIGLLIQETIGILGTLIGYSLGIQYGLWYQMQYHSTTIASLDASGTAQNLFGGVIFMVQQFITAAVISRRRRKVKKGAVSAMPLLTTQCQESLYYEIGMQENDPCTLIQDDLGSA